MWHGLEACPARYGLPEKTSDMGRFKKKLEIGEELCRERERVFGKE